MVFFNDISSVNTNTKSTDVFNIACWYWYASILLLAALPIELYSKPHFNDISVKYLDEFSDFGSVWMGDSNHYEVDSSSESPLLKQISGNTSGSNLICRPSEVAFGEWEFSVNFDGFQTSNQNFATVWIQRASIDSEHGIFIRIGENGSAKRIRLIASDPTGYTTELLASGTPLPADLATVHVRLTRSPTSLWTLRYRFNASGPWHSDQVTHPADLLPQSQLCLSTRFTPTRADKFSFGPIATSTHTTFLAHYTTPSPDQLHLHFSKLLPSNTGSTASVQIDGYTGSVTATTHLNTLRLRLTPAPGGGSRRLVVSGIFDPETTSQPISITEQIQWFDVAQQLDIVINEFTPRPLTPNDAFIELLNTSSRYIDINGWTIGRSSSSRPITHSRPIAPGDLIVVQRNSPPDPGSGSVHFVEAAIFPLGITTDRLFLRDVSDQLVDSVFYSSRTSSNWSSLRSIEKIMPTYAGMDPSNWAQHPDSDSRGLPNHSSQSLHPNTLLTISVTVTEDSIALRSDQFIRWDSQSLFTLSGSDVPLPVWDPFTSNRLTLPDHGITLHRSPIMTQLERFQTYDGSESLSFSIEAAQPPRPDDLVLNEILYQPLQDRYASHADQSEFVEIHNTKPWIISLKDVIIRDPIDKNGQFSSIMPDNPETWAIKGNSYALIVPDTAQAIQNSRLARFFVLEPDESWGHVRRSGLSLSTSGKPLILSLNNGEVLDSVHYSPEMHHPLLREQRGISLERVQKTSTSAQSHWTSSANPLGATPGSRNSVAVSESSTTVTAGLSFNPNPFSPDLDGHDDVVEITLTSNTIDRFTRITIYDINGRMVKTLLNDGLTGVYSSIIWDGTNDRGSMSPTGIYIVSAESYDHTTNRTRKFKKPLVLVRTR